MEFLEEKEKLIETIKKENHKLIRFFNPTEWPQRNQLDMKERNRREGLMSKVTYISSIGFTGKVGLRKVGAVAVAAIGVLCAVDIVKYTAKAANGESTEAFNSYTSHTLKAGGRRT